MGVKITKVKSQKDIKSITRKYFRYPHCGMLIKLKIDAFLYEKFLTNNRYLFPHLQIHGNPLHGTLCYLDRNLDIRNIEVIESIEISRNPDTFQQFLNKWSNPL